MRGEQGGIMQGQKHKGRDFKSLSYDLSTSGKEGEGGKIKGEGRAMTRRYI